LAGGNASLYSVSVTHGRSQVCIDTSNDAADRARDGQNGFAAGAATSGAIDADRAPSTGQREVEFEPLSQLIDLAIDLGGHDDPSRLHTTRSALGAMAAVGSIWSRVS
jgi:hypothetical protein